MSKIKRNNIAQFIDEHSKGKIFSALFTKKDGSARHMICRRGVSKGVKGIRSNSISDRDHNVLTVYEMPKNQFRRINLNTLCNIRIKGVEYNVED